MGVSQPVVGSDGTVYIATFALYPNVAPSTLHAIDGISGRVRWRLNIPVTGFFTLFHQPALGADGTIFVNSQQDLIAVRPGGTLKWVFRGAAYDSLNDPLPSPDGSVYVRAYFAGILRIDANGAQVWPTGFDIGNGSPLGAPFAVRVDGTLIVVGDRAWALAADQQLLWSFATPQNSSYDFQPPIVTDDHRVIIPSANAVQVLSSGGTLQWTRARGFASDSWVAAATGGTVYVGGAGSVLALNTNGSPRWSHVLSGIPRGTIGPAAIGANGTLYSIVDQPLQTPEVRALDATTGRRLWGSPIQRAPHNPQFIRLPLPAPVIGLNGTLIVSDVFGGTVRALR